MVHLSSLIIPFSNICNPSYPPAKAQTLVRHVYGIPQLILSKYLGKFKEFLNEFSFTIFTRRHTLIYIIIIYLYKSLLCEWWMWIYSRFSSWSANIYFHQMFALSKSTAGSESRQIPGDRGILIIFSQARAQQKHKKCSHFSVSARSAGCQFYWPLIIVSLSSETSKLRNVSSMTPQIVGKNTNTQSAGSMEILKLNVESRFWSYTLELHAIKVIIFVTYHVSNSSPFLLITFQLCKYLLAKN